MAVQPPKIARLEVRENPYFDCSCSGGLSQRIALAAQLKWVLVRGELSEEISGLLRGLAEYKVILLTTHRRESFGVTMLENLRVLQRFVERHEDVVLVFPVHPNPAVWALTEEVLKGRDRVNLLEPLS